MRLSGGRAAVLFRFHKDFDVARARIELIRHYNPGVPVHGLFGGDATHLRDAARQLGTGLDSLWGYPDGNEAEWKWAHTDLVLKAWHRSHGATLDFDFLYSYEYDLLTLAPLKDLYPDIDGRTIALSACDPFTDLVERAWYWTSGDRRAKFLRFQEHMRSTYGLERQSKVSLGPAPLFPRTFLDQWAATEDVTWVNEEVAYPAYAEALGFATVDHGMHAGFEIITHGRFAAKENRLSERYFNCGGGELITLSMILEQLADPFGRRTFHPVKYRLTLDDLLEADNRSDPEEPLTG